MPINPNTDSDYAQTTQNRSDLASAQNFVTQTDALDDKSRAMTLERNGLDEAGYQQMKIKTGMAPMPKPGQGENAGPPDSAADSAVKGVAAGGPQGLESAVTQGMKNIGDFFQGQVNNQKLFAAQFATDPEKAIKATKKDIASASSTAIGATAGGEGGEPEGEAAATEQEPSFDDAELKDFASKRAAAMQEATRGISENPDTGLQTVRPKSAEFAEAEAHPMTAGELNAMPPGTPRLASQNVAVVDFVHDQAQELHALAKEAATSGDAGAQGQVAQKFLQMMLSYEPKLQGAMHEAGRSVGILADPTLPKNMFIRQFSDLSDQLMNNSDLTKEDLTSAIANLKTPNQIASLASQANALGAGGLMKHTLYSMYLNTLLSWGTAAVKGSSDALQLIYQPAMRGVGQILSRGAELATGADYGTMGTRPGEMQAMIKAYASTFSEATRFGLQSALKNEPVFQNTSPELAKGGIGFLDNPVTNRLSQGTGWEDSMVGKGIDYLGHVSSNPVLSGIRGVVGVDQFAKAMQYRANLAAIAQRTAYDGATAAGLEGTEHAAATMKTAARFTRNPTVAMIRQAAGKMNEATFTQPMQPGSWSEMINQARQKSFALRTLLPFFGTPTNIMLEALRSSPLAAVSPTAIRTVAGGGSDAAVQVAKIAFGTSLMGLITQHALEGNITGAAPQNSQVRKVWERDNQEYSFKVPEGTPGATKVGSNYFLSYKRTMEPFSWQMALAADTAPMWAHLKDHQVTQAAGILGQASANEFERQPMWGVINKGMSLMESVRNGDVNGIGKVMGEMVPNPVPSTIKDFAGEVDPIRRQTLSYMDSLRNSIPWLSKDSLPTLDPFGRPEVVPPGFLFNEWPAFKAPKLGVDPTADKLVDLFHSVGFVPPDVPKALNGRADPEGLNEPPNELHGATLTEAERNKWREARSDPFPGRVPSLYDRVTQLTNLPAFQNMQDQAQSDMLMSVFHQYTHMGANRLMTENPDIEQRVIDAKFAKMTSKLPRNYTGPMPVAPKVATP